MKWSGYIRQHLGAMALGCIFFLGLGCSDGGTGSEDEQTGATLRGQIVLFGAAAVFELGPDPASAKGAGDPFLLALAPTNNVDVSIGDRKTTTDATGSFLINDIPLGDNSVSFSGSGISADYLLGGVEVGTTILLDSIRVNGGEVKTKHTGTWVGTAGSTEPGSQGQIVFTLIIEANGNDLSGTASIPAPDSSEWSMTGKETGLEVEGEMTLESTKSSCATGGEFVGTFLADTLTGTFVEVNPPTACGSPESGIFRVVKQQPSG